MSLSSTQTAHGFSQDGHVGKGKEKERERGTGFVAYLFVEGWERMGEDGR